MDRYKLKKVFLKLALLLTLGVNSLPSWAYNQMCHSPVQLAALLSPNKPKLSTGEKIRNKIKAYEKKREAIEVRMDEQEDNLGDSLDEKKLGQDPYSVASEIRNYIENKQDGWPCVQDDTTTSIHYTGDKDFLKYFPVEHFTRNFLLKVNVLDLLIPSAYAKTKPSEVEQGTASSTPAPSIEVCPNIEGQIQIENPIYDLKLKSNPDVPKKICKCPDEKPQVVNNKCAPCNAGTKWNGKRCEDQCQGGTWTGNPGKCNCPNNKPKLDNKKCVACEEGTEWFKNKCLKECPKPKTRNEGTGKCECPRGTFPDGNKGCTTQDVLDQNACDKKSKEGWEWTGGECVCKDGHGLESGKCVLCSGKGSNWEFQGTNVACKCDTSKFKEDGETCREKTCQEKKGPNFVTQGTDCVCPEPHYEEVKGDCLKVSEEEKCTNGGGNLDTTILPHKCNCSNPKQKWDKDQLKCKDKPAQELCEEQANKSWVKGKCVDCPEWKKHSAFEDDGEVDSSFCDRYALDKHTRACKNALSRLSRLTITLEKYQDAIDKLEDQLLGLDDSEDTKTQAGGVCLECLKRELKANRQTPGQMIGNFSKILTGVGLSMVGYSAGQKAQTDANMLRIQQGYAAENDMYSLQGAGFGFPFIANGLYGMTRTNTPVGGWSCTPSVNPHGHAHSQYAHGQGYVRPYYL